MTTLVNFISLLSFIIILTTTTAATTSYLPPTPPPPPPYNLSTLLTTLGFHTLSTAATATSFHPNTTTTTIFSPTDASLGSCPYCSLPLLLLEHSVPGLYPFHLLSTFTFATKIQTLASTPSTPLCLTLTKSSSTPPTLFVGGVEITRPDLFNDGRLVIHGIQGYLTHLSPLSCQIDRMTSLTFPSRPLHVHAPTSTDAMHMHAWLTQAMHDLRMREYVVLALLIQENLERLVKFNCMTIFGVNDGGLFGDGNRFVHSFGFHVVPGKRLTGLELIGLPMGAELGTMVDGEGLVVTVGGGGGPLAPMRVNNVRVMRTNIVLNEGVVVHRIARPFRRVHRTGTGYWPDETEGGMTDGR